MFNKDIVLLIVFISCFVRIRPDSVNFNCFILMYLVFGVYANFKFL